MSNYKISMWIHSLEYIVAMYVYMFVKLDASITHYTKHSYKNISRFLLIYIISITYISLKLLYWVEKIALFSVNFIRPFIFFRSFYLGKLCTLMHTWNVRTHLGVTLDFFYQCWSVFSDPFCINLVPRLRPTHRMSNKPHPHKFWHS